MVFGELILSLVLNEKPRSTAFNERSKRKAEDAQVQAAQADLREGKKLVAGSSSSSSTTTTTTTTSLMTGGAAAALPTPLTTRSLQRMQDDIQKKRLAGQIDCAEQKK